MVEGWLRGGGIVFRGGGLVMIELGTTDECGRRNLAEANLQLAHIQTEANKVPALVQHAQVMHHAINLAEEDMNTTVEEADSKTSEVEEKMQLQLESLLDAHQELLLKNGMLEEELSQSTTASMSQGAGSWFSSSMHDPLSPHQAQDQTVESIMQEFKMGKFRRPF